jgi:hypothetical protein
MPNAQDRVDAIAALIRETPSADRDALICSIVSRWPDTTAEEIELALELASALEVELIRRGRCEARDYWRMLSD